MHPNYHKVSPFIAYRHACPHIRHLVSRLPVNRRRMSPRKHLSHTIRIVFPSLLLSPYSRTSPSSIIITPTRSLLRRACPAGGPCHRYHRRSRMARQRQQCLLLRLGSSAPCMSRHAIGSHLIIIVISFSFPTALFLVIRPALESDLFLSNSPFVFSMHVCSPLILFQYPLPRPLFTSSIHRQQINYLCTSSIRYAYCTLVYSSCRRPLVSDRL